MIAQDPKVGCDGDAMFTEAFALDGGRAVGVVWTGASTVVLNVWAAIFLAADDPVVAMPGYGAIEQNLLGALGAAVQLGPPMAELIH